jgi:hypothetical protein
VPGSTTTVAALDVDRQNVPALAIKARFPNIAFQTTMVAKIGVAAREASIFLAFKILSYVSQVIGHKFDTLPSFRSRLRSLPLECNTNAIFFSSSSIFHMKIGCFWQQSAGVVEHWKISNSKHQITNKSQIPILNDQNRFGISNFGHCYLFDI